jgi:uncharacterized protein YjbI with pentapeptide repeats
VILKSWAKFVLEGCAGKDYNFGADKANMMTECRGTCEYVARKEDPSNWHGRRPSNWLLDSKGHTGLSQVVWKCPHDALDKRDYCAFHTDPEELPTEVDEGELFIDAVNEASASSNEERARRKKQFVGATFNRFDISGATLDAGDEYPIRLDHAAFTRGVLADKAVIKHDLYVQGSRFETGYESTSDEIGPVSFEDAEFSGDNGVSFEGTEFSGDGEVSFLNAKFDGDGDIFFINAEFGGDGDVFFINTEFSGDGGVSFTRTEFSGDGDVWFEGAQFSVSGVSFERAEFSGDSKTSFEGAEFNVDGDVWFFNTKFSGDGDVWFFSPRFNVDGDVLFEDAEFSVDGDVLFEDAEFSEGTILSFKEAKIGSICTFENMQFTTKGGVTFTDAEVEERLIFERDTAALSREMRGRFDFSNAVIHDGLSFRSSTQSASDQTESDDELPPFDLVFTDTVDFSGANLKEPPDFSRTQFPADTDFSDAVLQNANFQNADLTGSDEISTASFDRADLSGVNFSGSILTGASFERALLSRAELLGTDLTRTKLYGALLGDARINDDTMFWLPSDAPDRVPDNSRFPIRALRTAKGLLREYSHKEGAEPYCVYDPRFRGADKESDLEKAAETYGTLETVARQNSRPELASECFLGRKDVQLRRYWRDRNLWMVLRSTVPTVVARYGESPLRVLGTGAFTILGCTYLYFTFSLIEHGDTGEPATLFESFYFSTLTFTTLGYGDFNPITSAGQLLAVAETSIGVVLLAILVFVFGRRATR